MIYFAKLDENNRPQRIKQCGRTMALSANTHYKSLSMVDYKNIIFEEFVTNGGYLYDEPSELMQFVSTVARRRKIKVWLIGNTISRICPYFTEWSLDKIPRQKQGTIDIYNFDSGQFDENGEAIVVKLAVEYCENSGKNSKMFFGAISESISSGMWESKNYPKLPNKFKEHKRLYTALLVHKGFKYKLDVIMSNEYLVLFVYPFTNKSTEPKRQITDVFNTSQLHTHKFTVVTRGDNLLLDCIRNRKVVFSDNLTGTEFWQIIDNEGVL